MSAILILQDTSEVIGTWTGELPKEGDLVFFEQMDRLMIVGSVIHVRGIHLPHGEVPQTYPTKMTRIVIEDVEPDEGAAFQKKLLKKVNAQGY